MQMFFVEYSRTNLFFKVRKIKKGKFCDWEKWQKKYDDVGGQLAQLVANSIVDLEIHGQIKLVETKKY